MEFDKNQENILLKCEVFFIFYKKSWKFYFFKKYELNFKNLMVNFSNFKQELIKLESEMKNQGIFQQGNFLYFCKSIVVVLKDSLKSLWETLNIIHERLFKIEKNA